MAGLDTGPRHKTRMWVWVASADCGTRAHDVPLIQQREGSTRTKVGMRNRDEAAGKARECAEGGKMVCPAGYPAAIQHGEGD